MAVTSVATAVPLRLRWLQLLDHRIGPALCRMAPRPGRTGTDGAPLPSAQVRRVLVIRPGGLGDAVLLRPALAALSRAWPDAAVDVLAERRNVAGLRIGAAPCATLLYDESPAATLRQLRRRRYDLVIDTEQYHCFPALLARLLSPRWICGFDSLDREALRTHPVAHDEGRCEVDCFLDLVNAVTGANAAQEPGEPFLEATAADLAWADGALMRTAGAPLAVIIPAAGGSFRLWPVERYGEVAVMLLGRGYRVAIVGGTDAIEAGAAIAAAVGRSPLVIDMTGRTTLAQTAAILARARFALGPDSGVLHIAAALGTPTVALFGPGLWRKWAPRGPRHRLVRLGLPCSPCVAGGRLPPCPHDVACMRDLASAPVLAAILSLEGSLA
ncbi:MAG: glycosyltransferase family 9 protein [Gammaproteobacteria bacterium]|nr:glycosyltransferase family 9 protein [Gammaproteobacteria bacterium]